MGGGKGLYGFGWVWGCMRSQRAPGALCGDKQ